MNALKRFIFIILFMPICTINAIYDTMMFIVKGDNHGWFVMLNWLSNKLIDN
jgi:hypothetical protein